MTADEDEGIDWKATSRRWEARARANKDAADEVTALRNIVANLRARLDRGETDAAPARLELVCHEVAAEFGQPLAVVVGDTEEQIRANARKVADWAGAGPSR